MAKRNTYFQDEIVEKKIDAKQFRKILRYAIPYKMIFFIVGILLMVSAAISMVAPRLIRYIVDVDMFSVGNDTTISVVRELRLLISVLISVLL